MNLFSAKMGQMGESAVAHKFSHPELALVPCVVAGSKGG